MNKSPIPWFGLLLALTPAVFWGMLPIAMKQVLVVMEPTTIVWYRFAIAFLGLGIILVARRQLPSVSLFRQPRWLLLLCVATLGLGGNFILFSSSVQYLTPTASQVIAQISPIGLMFASVLVLKERVHVYQVLGGMLLLLGLVLFFNQNLQEIVTHFTDYTVGVLLGCWAAAMWVCYGVAQKILLRRLAAQQILLLLYFLCTLLLLPVLPAASFSVIWQLSAWQWACLLFCAVNTLIAYGALVEAMVRLQAAQVSALITLTPLCTLLFSDLLALFFPDMFAMPVLNGVGYLGAFVVVAGAMVAAVGHKLFPVIRRWRRS